MTRARWRKRGGQVNLGEHDEIRIDDSSHVDDVWAQEWTRSVIERAREAVRSGGNQSEQSWEAFDLYGRRGVPAAEVAERLSMSPEAVRLRLIEERSVGVIAIREVNALRIAYCSTRAEDLPEIVGHIDDVVRQLAG